ncbi:MAG TPA: hypothetical protein VF516_26650, partial [Kofleriaceae bacterium]
DHGRRRGIGVALGRVAGLGRRELAAGAGAVLLRGVRHLVREQVLPARIVRPVLAAPEHDVQAGRERAGLDAICMIRRGVSGVNPHAGQIAAERLLELGARGVGQRIPCTEILDQRVLSGARGRHGGLATRPRGSLRFT